MHSIVEAEDLLMFVRPEQRGAVGSFVIFIM